MDGRRFASRNPADNRDTVAEAPLSGRADVDRAVAAARAAFSDWRLLPAPRRGEILFRAGELLRKNKQLLGELGAATMDRLRAFQEHHPLVGDVRGMGLMIGVELTGSDGKPDGAACGKVLEECLKQGLIVINCGPERNIIRFIPPLTISDEEMGQALDILEQAIDTAEMK